MASPGGGRGKTPAPSRVRLFLCGDVMTGRGVDQIMAHPSDPVLYEGGLASALDYVRLAEAANGPIARRAPPAYIWGAALDELSRRRPDVRLINLETSVTRSNSHVPKGINYRMSPQNADCLSAAGVDCCVLANNHVLDWGRAGLLETLDRLARLNIKTAGAGRNAEEASKPAIVDLPGEARILVFSFASTTSGVPWDWEAREDAPGVALLPDLGERGGAWAAERMSSFKRPHDIVVASIHWGSNWGYEIPDDQRQFAHALIDRAGISILHGHSSHHARAIEVYRNRLILYGCGDFLNDYEGIEGYEDFRGDLALMYFVDVDAASGDLESLEMTPLQIKRFQLQPASRVDAAWLGKTLDRESARFGARVNVKPDKTLALSWRTVGRPGG
ncbi:MAG TPA: CapA family protein [Roseiarcus sp.]|nr:CapA family protein [Roseiarcus sp.]